MTCREPVSGLARNPLIGMRPADMKHVAVGVALRDLAPAPRGLLICRLNGEWLLREDWGTLTQPDDVIEWYDVPQDKEDVRSLLQVATIVASIFFPVALPYVLAANIAYNLLVPPTQPKAPRRPEDTGNALTTGLSGNEARLDQPIWKICGRREINPPFACSPYFEYRPRVGTESTDDEELDNEQYFFALFAVGVGNQDVVAKIGNTPISRFADVLVAQYLPPGVQPSTVSANVTTAQEVSGQVLDSGQYIGGFAACAPRRTCASVGIDVVATRGLGKGEDPLTVTWRVEYREINDFGQVLSAWSTLGTESRTAYTSTPQRWTVTYLLDTPARVEIRLLRTDVKDTDPSALHELAWTGLRAYLDEAASLNEHTAHYEVVMRASEQLSQIASRDVRLIVEAHARSLDAALEWQAEAHTRTAAWWLLDLATSSTWGIGKPDSRVDLQSFYDLAQTNEARQDRFDWVFDSTVSAWDAMQLIARSCRARVFRRNGVLSVARDELVDVSVTAFTPRNCQPGMKVQEKLRTRNSPDGYIVEYQDHRTLEWTPIECPCPGVETMSNPVFERLEGITGAKHAEREGIYKAWNLLYRPRIAEWITEMQGMLPAFMSPVDFIADIRGYGHSGDVAYWDADTLVMGLTEPPDFSAGTLYLTLIRDDGSLTTAVAVTPGPTANDIVLPASPDFDLVLDDGTRERPKYLLGAKDVVKVVSIEDGGKTEDGAQLYRLTGVIDDDRVHTADVHLLPGPGEIQDPVGDPDDSEEGGGSALIVRILDRTIYAAAVGVVTVRSTYRLGNDGTAGFITTDPFGGADHTGTYSNEWLLGSPVELADASLYEARATLLSEPLGTGLPVDGTMDTWLALSTLRSWSTQQSSFGAQTYAPNAVLLIEIRDIATSVVQDSATIHLISEASTGG